MEELKTSDFYYELPPELIAQDPLEDRSSSRLMVLDKETGEVSHHVFKEIGSFLEPGDCLVLNNTKVIPARLMGVREETGGAIEVLLLKRRENDIWETLVKPGKKARPGTKLVFGDGLLHAEVLEVVEEGWVKCPCLPTSPTSSRTRTVTRPFMPGTRDRRQRPPQGFILHRSF